MSDEQAETTPSFPQWRVEKVEAAADQIEAAGGNVSGRSVWAITGGSYRELGPVVKHVKARRKALKREDATVPPMSEEVEAAVRRLYCAIWRCGFEEHELEREALFRQALSAEEEAAVADEEADLAAQARDAALAERDAAIDERDAAIAERDEWRTERDALRVERDAAVAERDEARGAREKAEAECAWAVAERDRARIEGDQHRAERDALLADRDAATVKLGEVSAERDAAAEAASIAVRDRDGLRRDNDGLREMLGEMKDVLGALKSLGLDAARPGRSAKAASSATGPVVEEVDDADQARFDFDPPVSG